MINVEVRDLIKIMKGNLIIGDPRQQVRRIAIDTRTMERGDFFLALKGMRFDGHDFISNTLEKGAAGLIVSRLSKDIGKNPLNYRQFPTVVMVDNTLKALQIFSETYRKRFVPTVIGITGSNGKTTTKDMLSYILSLVDQCVYTQGNYNNHIGLPLTLLDIGPEHRFVITEMGASQPGDIRELCTLADPRVGIITNIGPAHLQSFGSVDSIIKTKMELLEYLPEDGEAIINGDDPFLRGQLKRIRCRVTTFGLEPSCTVCAVKPVYWPEASFRLRLADASYPIKLAYPGKCNVYNALAAAAAAWRVGAQPEQILQGLSKSVLPPMRFEVKTTKDNTVLVNDAYNANPVSMRSSIDTFMQAYGDRKKVLVLGDMRELGDQARQEHTALGTFIAQLSVDMVLVVGEHRQYVCDGARSAGMASDKIKSYNKRNYLFEDLMHLMGPSVAILFKASRDVALDEVVNQIIRQTSL
ncbi:MAG: UDP-N-acetylmuramoyl-tripeptide--D-alanyl-D-alanine ligase [Elusimicrobia bacterium]|nr:UDP-N-acetylmuramoyl-tripeptide--D-alanyl-D-alanine ligase [Elusimicrobiota bacterium]MBD3411729.1 UDP-N-acetylmuramoyl-tripeptide--D-alanyl-D-alanine ligase [Elusimicrobiota bacterium]